MSPQQPLRNAKNADKVMNKEVRFDEGDGDGDDVAVAVEF